MAASSEDWATVHVCAGDDWSPTVKLHADLESMDDRGRRTGQALVIAQHLDTHLAQLGCDGSEGRPGGGFVTVAGDLPEQKWTDEDRIRLGVEKGQATLSLLSPTDELRLAAGPEGAAVAIEGPKLDERLWLDVKGLRGTR